MIAIFMILLVDTLAITLVLPLMPFYAERLGATPEVIGLVFASYSFCQMIAGPILGQLSDRIGRKPLLIISQVGSFLGFVLLGLGNSLWLVFASRIIDGLTAGNVSLAYAAVSDVTEPHERSQAFGWLGMALSLGFLVGPALGGFLATYDLRYAAGGAIFFSLVSIGTTIVYFPAKSSPSEPQPRRTFQEWLRQYLEPWQRPSLRPLLQEYGIFCLISALYLTGIATFSQQRFQSLGLSFSPSLISYLFAYGGLLSMLIQGYLFGRFASRWGERPLIIIGFAISCAGLITLYFAQGIALLVVTHTLLIAGIGFLRPGLMGLISKQAGAFEQGAVLGLSQSTNSIAQIGGPLIANSLISQHWLAAYALGTGGVALLGLTSSVWQRSPISPSSPTTSKET